LGSFKKITESKSPYRHLEKMPVKEILLNINKEDKNIAVAIAKALPQIEKLVKAVVDKMQTGGRLFYIGAGTSGRLGVLDASECPPTFGVDADLVNAIIAGGEKAITTAVESAEDDVKQGWKNLKKYKITTKDIVIGIAASGTTPYVIGALKKCKEKNIATGSIACNPNSPISKIANHSIEIVVGPEFITGSTRMKSGTAIKMVLNMISTTAMIQLGRVEDNQMVNMQLTNDKLIDRGVHILMQKLKLHDYEKTRSLLLHYGTVKKALDALG
jgi:N-acetylmuramic acid 6-phosphate etherase